MPTITIPRTDITTQQISAALRAGLDSRYDVLPGMRMTRIPAGSPQAAGADEIMVGKGPTPMVRAQVTIIRRADHTDIRITPGGVAGDLLMNAFGIARKIRRVLLDAPGISHKARPLPGGRALAGTAAVALAGVPGCGRNSCPGRQVRMNSFATSRRALRGIALMIAICAVVGGCGSAAHRPPPNAPPPLVAAAPVQVAHTPAEEVSYRSAGTGPLLLLITGYPFSMDDWPPVFVDTLAQHYRVIIFDNAGVGQTTLPPGPLSISTMAGQTDGLIHALHLGPADVLGCSMGGMIAQAVAVLHPADVAKLVLCATAPGTGHATPPTPAADAELARPNQVLGLEKLLFPADEQATEIPAFAKQIAQYPDFYYPSAAGERAQAAASLAWLSGHDPAGPRIGQITAPTLIGDGEDDQALPPTNDYVLHSGIPGSQLVLYPDAGHGFFFQDLAAWTEKVESFLGPG
jgi:pimeloyl-ACP methyl ester carboxylesterase